MQTKLHTSFSVIYFIVVIDTIVCSSIETLMPMYYFTKPAIVTLLVIYFWLQSFHLDNRTRHITLLALIFSLVGDILLMFSDKSPNYFIGGLVAFLLAHLMYISVFLRLRNKATSPLSILVVLVIYAIGMFYFLKDGLGEMLFPILAYILVILAMVVSAFLRKRLGNINSYNLVFAGAILFMISDSLLALNKFSTPLPFSEISIMLTYASAQYLIVLGILNQKD
jgi:uncharacterized membrane protein YhhN